MVFPCYLKFSQESLIGDPKEQKNFRCPKQLIVDHLGAESFQVFGERYKAIALIDRASPPFIILSSRARAVGPVPRYQITAVVELRNG